MAELNFVVQGYWWIPADRNRRLTGTLKFDHRSGATLELSGRFRGFRSFEPGGFGAPSARSVVVGRTADGQSMTLFDVVEQESVRRPSSRRGRRFERATYSSHLLARGHHFLSWQAFRLVSLAVTLRGFH